MAASIMLRTSSGFSEWLSRGNAPHEDIECRRSGRSYWPRRPLGRVCALFGYVARRAGRLARPVRSVQAAIWPAWSGSLKRDRHSQESRLVAQKPSEALPEPGVFLAISAGLDSSKRRPRVVPSRLVRHGEHDADPVTECHFPRVRPPPTLGGPSPSRHTPACRRFGTGMPGEGDRLADHLDNGRCRQRDLVRPHRLRFPGANPKAVQAAEIASFRDRRAACAKIDARNVADPRTGEARSY